MGSCSPSGSCQIVQLLDLEPSSGDESAPIQCRAVCFPLESLPEFTVLCSPLELPQASDAEILIDELPRLIPCSLALALKRLRYSSTRRKLWIESISQETPDSDHNFTNSDSIISHAQFVAFWREPRDPVVEDAVMDHFYVTLPKDRSSVCNSYDIEDRELRMMVLQPSKNQLDRIDIKLLTVFSDDIPAYTRFDGFNNIEDETGSVIIDGTQSSISSIDEDALRRLRSSSSQRYVIGNFMQKDDKKKSLLHFALQKEPEWHAFWQDHDYNTIVNDRNSKEAQMVRFTIIANRYRDTSKYYTSLDTTPGSREIRLLVLPPSGGVTMEILKCSFRNVNLDDANRPSYQIYQVAGPEAPRNGRDPVYRYDLEIGGYLCVTSDGLRVGLQWLQHASEERLIWNKEVCINCRDEKDVQHFNPILDDITKCATAGGVLTYGHVNLFTNSSNREFVLPQLDRNSREIRLLHFVKSSASMRDEIRCKLVVKNLDDAPRFKALSYTWGHDNGLAMHYTIFNPEDNPEDWPYIVNPTSKVTHLGDTSSLVETVSINESSFVITKNLGDALRCLRDRGGGKYFWIDAICIDQRDLLDRSSQVSLMGSIYSSAQQVIAWLGCGTEDTYRALQILNEIGSESFNVLEFAAWLEHQIRGIDSLCQTTVAENSSDYSTYSQILAALKDERFVDSVDEFVNKEWWHRLWVYQEATLPVELMIHCCESSINFNTLWLGIDLIRKFSAPERETIPSSALVVRVGKRLGWDNGSYARLAQIRRERRRRHDGWYRVSNEFLFYLSALGSRASTDPRDVIYATLGLTDGAPKSIIPNYSNSIIAVYTEAAKATIKQDNSLSLLSLYTGLQDSAEPWALAWLACDPDTRKREAPLPSWVPYWGRQHNGMGTQNLNNNLSTVPQFCAARGSNADPKFSKDGRILFARGVCVDVVTKVVPGYRQIAHRNSMKLQINVPSQDPPSDSSSNNAQETPTTQSLDRASWLSTFEAWEAAALGIEPLNPSYILGGTKADAFIHSLHTPFLCNCVSGVKDDFDISKAFLDFVRRRAKNMVQNDEPHKHEPSALATVMLEREAEHGQCTLTITDPRSKLIITERGYIGVVEGSPHIGDLVVVLRGGDVPFLLRRIGEFERYLLVCDAYAHGLMYGAAMQGMGDDVEGFRKFPIM